MLRALTIYQPWADLIVAGHKDIENRTWRPSRRQLVRRPGHGCTRRGHQARGEAGGTRRAR